MVLLWHHHYWTVNKVNIADVCWSINLMEDNFSCQYRWQPIHTSFASQKIVTIRFLWSWRLLFPLLFFPTGWKWWTSVTCSYKWRNVLWFMEDCLFKWSDMPLRSLTLDYLHTKADQTPYILALYVFNILTPVLFEKKNLTGLWHPIEYFCLKCSFPLFHQSSAQLCLLVSHFHVTSLISFSTCTRGRERFGLLRPM